MINPIRLHDTVVRLPRGLHHKLRQLRPDCLRLVEEVVGQTELAGEGDEPHVLLAGLLGLLMEAGSERVGHNIVVLGMEDQDRTLNIIK